jgi:hypothetical protein
MTSASRRCLACGIPYQTHGRRCPALPLAIGGRLGEAFLQGLVLLVFGAIMALVFVGWVS